MHTAAVCAGLLGLLVFALGLAVSLVRGQTNVVIGHTTDPTDRLYKLVRAHGNAAEFNPMLAVLILYLGAGQPSSWLQRLFVAAAAARVLHAAGMILSPSLARPQPLRAAGAVGTYAIGIALAIIAIARA